MAVQSVLVVLIAPLLVALAACSPSSQGRAHVRARPAGREFRHPGVLVDQAQLTQARERVDAGKEPQLTAYVSMRDSKYGALDYRATPYKVVVCPPGTRPGRGCVEEREDAVAAYTQALLWSVTGEREHARKAVEIMDAWSAVVREHTEDNAGLQAAWAGSTWARAAEIVRHSDAGWPASGVRRFEAMLRDVYLPVVAEDVPDFNGNWDLAMTDAAIGIAVFLDDLPAFDRAVARFRARVPAYFYLAEEDGKRPVVPARSAVHTPRQISAYWFGQGRYTDGLAQETCRNFKHVGYSIAATSHIAETAWHQGVDLYAEVEGRLRAAVEFHARYQLGAAVPATLCGGKLETNMGPDLEVAVNHFEDRLHVDVPQAHRLVHRTRPAGTDDLFVSWETLTHAGNPG